MSLAALALLVVLVPGAFAHWTSSSSGREVLPHTSVSGFVVEGGVEPTGLYPGGSVELTVKVTNPARHARLLQTLTAQVKEVGSAATSEVEAERGGKCWADWFEVTEVDGHAGSSYELKETVAAGSTVEHKVTLRMKAGQNDKNGCQRKKVTLEYEIE